MNAELNNDPTNDEIYMALREMHPTKAPGPDEMHALFYKKCWDIVGPDVISFVKKAWRREANLSCVNKTTIVLIPKAKDPKSISQYRPISLCNVL